jgi:pectate lyase
MKDSSAGARASARLARRAGVLAAAVAIVVSALVAATIPAAMAATLYSNDFESGDTSGWSKSGGTWGIATDGSKVFQQSKVDSDDARVVYTPGSGFTDYAAQVRVKPLAWGAATRFVALNARVQGATSEYRLALLDSNQAQLQVVNSGTATVLGSVATTVTLGTFYTLEIDISGSKVTALVNGAQIASATDTRFSSGTIGLATFHGTASFDDVLVSSIGSSPTPTLTGTPNPTHTPTPTPTPTPTGGGGSDTGLVGYAAISGDGHGPTTGGAGGPTVTVTSLSQLQTEAGRSGPEIIRVDGLFSGSGEVTVASNKSILGVGASSGLTGIGLSVKGQSNVVIRNLNISKVTASSGDGDAIHIESADHVWVDHNNLFSDMSHGKDFYDGLVDITHAGDFVTVSWNTIHDHFKVSLVGHSDSNGSEDTGHLHVTYHHNLFQSFNSRTPSLRFGTGHVFDNYFNTGDTAVHSRENAQMLVQNNVFRSVTTPIETTGDSPVDGFVNQSGNDFGGGTNNITQTGTFTSPPYGFTLDPTASVIGIVTNGAGTGKIST